MGLRYLNHAAMLKCVHGGAVQLIPPPRRSMHVQRSPVLTDRDLLSAIIVGCPQVGPGLKPCLKIVSITMGLSSDIKVDGQTPILKSLQAMTDGVAPGIVTAFTDGRSNAETLAGAASIGDPGEDDERRRLEMARDALDVIGTIDPTPASDLASAAISIKLGDWWGAGLSIVSTVPYVGDAIAKPIKAARRARSLFKGTGKVANLGKLRGADKAAADAMRAQKRDPRQIRQVLESGDNFGPKPLKQGDKLYGFATAGKGKNPKSAYWVDEKTYKNLEKKHYKEGKWDQPGVKADLALPCTNSADDVVSATVTRDHDAVKSTIRPADDHVYEQAADGSWTRSTKHYPGGQEQVTPDPSAISMP